MVTYSGGGLFREDKGSSCPHRLPDPAGEAQLLSFSIYAQISFPVHVLPGPCGDLGLREIEPFWFCDRLGPVLLCPGD